MLMRFYRKILPKSSFDKTEYISDQNNWECNGDFDHCFSNIMAFCIEYGVCTKKNFIL